MSVAAEEHELAGEDDLELGPRGRWAYARHRFVHNRLATASLVVLVLMFGAGLLAHHLAPYPPHQINIRALSESPNWRHPFGTDQYGLDYFSRILYGLGRAARVAFVAGALGTLIGVTLGALAGYYGGWLDNVLMRFTEAVVAVPALALVLTADAYLQANGAWKFGLLLALVLWSPLARVVRAAALSLREKEYVDAARALGASDLTILRRHLLPNLIGPIAVSIALLLSAAVLVEPAVAYLFHGPVVNSQATSLGDVLGGAQDAGPYQWWGETFPGLTIVVIVVCINFVGEGMRDALDPAPRRHVAAPSPRKRPQRVSRPFGVAAEAVASIVRKPIVASRRIAGVPLDWIAAGADHWRGVRRGRRVLVEALLLAASTTAAAGVIYADTVHDFRSAWPVAGTSVIDVSRTAGPQTEVSAAVDPADPRVILAGSNSGLDTISESGNPLVQTLVYTSRDGGAHWSSSIGPASAVACGPGDPALTFDGRGRAYYALLLSPVCGDETGSFLVVAERARTSRRWRVERVAAPSYQFGFDDKPAIAADRHGGVYVVWSRLLSDRYETFVLSHSDDHGRTWTRPRVLDRALKDPILPSIAIAPSGDVYVAGVDARYGVFVLQVHGRAQSVAPLSGNPAPTCITVQEGRPIPGQSERCIGPSPTISTARGRVYVTYAAGDRVFAGVFDSTLHPIANGEVAPLRRQANRFWPASAADPATGDLWVCFYDTSGDSTATRAWFSCTLSKDGHRWASPVRVARKPADVGALWSDAAFAGFDDQVHYGGYVAVAVSHGVAHPMWVDTNGNREEEIYGARLAAGAFR